jgi:hypothetical protein
VYLQKTRDLQVRTVSHSENSSKVAVSIVSSVAVNGEFNRLAMMMPFILGLG